MKIRHLLLIPMAVLTVILFVTLGSLFMQMLASPGARLGAGIMLLDILAAIGLILWFDHQELTNRPRR